MSQDQPTNAALEGLSQRIFGDSGIKIKYSESAGRYVVSDIALKPAEVVLVSEPYTHVIGEHCLNWVCDACCRVHMNEGEPFEYSCPDCDISYYCCEDCKKEHQVSPIYSHAAECQHFQKLKRVDKSNLDDLSITKLRQLIRLLCKRNFERQDNSHLKRKVLYADVESLVTHDVGDSSEEEYRDIVKIARRVLPRDIISDSDSYLVAMLSRIDCNQFGIWSTKDEFLGAAVHPLASFLNHSCIPNVFAEWEGVKLLCRTLYPVPAGTELNLSYIAAGVSTPERKSELKRVYSFDCSCPRCSLPPSQAAPYDAFFHEFLQCPVCPGVMKFVRYDQNPDGSTGETRACMTCAHQRSAERAAPPLHEFVKQWHAEHDNK